MVLVASSILLARFPSSSNSMMVAIVAVVSANDLANRFAVARISSLLKNVSPFVRSVYMKSSSSLSPCTVAACWTFDALICELVPSVNGCTPAVLASWSTASNRFASIEMKRSTVLICLPDGETSGMMGYWTGSPITDSILAGTMKRVLVLGLAGTTPVNVIDPVARTRGDRLPKFVC